MAETFVYEELDLQPIRASFESHGEVLVSLSMHHAVACIELIGLIENTQNLSRGWFRRAAFLAHALYQTLRLALCHGRLFFLCPLLILFPVSKDWEQLSDGSFLFKFSKNNSSRG
jgi:hypothetical protein